MNIRASGEINVNGRNVSYDDFKTLIGKLAKLNTDQTVEAAAKAAGADVVGFQRLAVGEGIEKVVEDYAAEVMKQAGLAPKDEPTKH